MIKTGNSNNRWYTLIVTVLISALIGGAERLCIPVLFKEISIDLDMGLVAIGTVWGMDGLAGAFVSLPGGMVADRFGMKRTITAICFLGAAFGALRGLSTDFLSLAATMLMFGLTTTALASILPKVTAQWFGSQRLGFANGIVNAGLALGMILGTILSASVLSPLLGGWRNVIFFWGVPAFILGLVWLISVREPRKSELDNVAVKPVPFRQAISQVMHTKEVWVIGILSFLHAGGMTGVNGYLPLYLRNIGWDPLAADTAVSIIPAVSIIGMFPIVLLSDKLKMRRGLVIICLVLFGTSLILLPFAGGAALWVLILVNGFLRTGMPALIFTLTCELKGVGGTYAGTAMGLASSLFMFGGFVLSPLGNSLADFGPGMPFVFWGVLALLSAPGFFLIKEYKRSDGVN